MRRVVPLLLACALVSACVAPDEEDTIGRSSLRATVVDQGVTFFDVNVAPGETVSFAVETDVDTQFAGIATELLSSGGLVLVKLADVPTPENADLVADSAGEATSYIAPANAAVNVVVQAPATTAVSARLKSIVVGGGNDCADPGDENCGISTSP